MSNEDIARRSGLAKSTVQKLSRLDNWGTVSLDTYDKFTAGCGIDPLRASEHLRFWRRRKLAYLEQATLQQRRMFESLLRVGG